MHLIERVELEFANGARRVYERLKSSGLGAVIIVPVLADGTVLLVREYAVAFHRYELGLPKGRIDPGEDALQAANRELQEEVGYAARTLTRLRNLSLAPSYMSHETTIVLAEDLYPSRLQGDEPEELEVVPVALDEIDALALRDEVSEGRTIAALYMARAWLRSRA